MGGRLLQGVNRDTLGMSFKCSAAKINGEWRDIYKEPKTDTFKISKKGKLRLSRNASCAFETFPQNSGTQDELVTVFKDGEVKQVWTFDQIWKRADRLLYFGVVNDHGYKTISVRTTSHWVLIRYWTHMVLFFQRKNNNYNHYRQVVCPQSGCIVASRTGGSRIFAISV
jgi:hypothetical protein